MKKRHLGDVIIHPREVVLVAELGRDWETDVHAKVIEVIP
jgi:hypothetical protein